MYPNSTKAIVCEAGNIFVEDITLEGIASAQKMCKETDLKERLVKHDGERVEMLVQAWFGIWTLKNFRDWSMKEELHKIVSPLLFYKVEMMNMDL